MNKDTKVIDMGATVYDINKQLVKKLTPLSELELPQKQKALEDWFNMHCDCYAMLLCHEQRDYTVFHMYDNPPANPNPPAIAAKELIECLKNRGVIISIDPTQDGAWEIWLQIGDESYCYYLFRYDDAVIEC